MLVTPVKRVYPVNPPPAARKILVKYRIVINFQDCSIILMEVLLPTQITRFTSKPAGGGLHNS